MGCGSFHLVDKNAQDVFIDKEHVVIYENDIDLISKIDYYLKHEEERECIANNGYEYVKNKFTMVKSLEIILKSITFRSS